MDAVDLEVQVTVVEIERADGFNVSSQLFTRIEVLLVVPGHPTGLAQLHLFGQIFIVHHLVTNKANGLNLGGLTFVHNDGQTNTVTIQRRHRRLHVHAIVATSQILTTQLLVSTVKRSTVKNTAFSHTDITQTLFDGGLIESADTLRANGCNSRTLLQLND